jgi:DHA1 family tetracycline resistance protein-like MFS transporter
VTARSVLRRMLVLAFLRWLPVGLMIPVLVLLPLERGLTLAQYGLAAAAQGVVVLLLELPTGGLADALGRRPVLLLAGGVSLVSLSLLAVADAPLLFVAVYLLQGLYRALDSGPLEAWYVDTALAADPDADIETGLSRAGGVLSLAIAVGALAGGGLVALGPIGTVSALTVPVLAAIAVTLVSVIAVAVLLVEVRPPRGMGALRTSLRGIPAAVGGAFGLVRRSRILLALIAVELFWGFGMVTFEVLMPVRLAEVMSTPAAAAALLGPTGSAAWLVSALGALAVPLLARRIGAPWTAASLRIAHGVTVVGMALAAGPVGVVAAYLLCYTVHGAANPVHAGLLHRQVDGPYRSSVISLNSMVSQPAGALGGIALTALAASVSVSAALLAGAVVLALAAPLYLVAGRGGTRPRDPVQDGVSETSVRG